MKSRSRNMLEGPLLSGIVSYAIPSVLTCLLQILFNAADLMVVGQFCGSLSVGAVGATGPVVNLIITLFIGISGGTGVAIAHAIGSGDSQRVHRTVHTTLLIALISGAIITVVGFFASEALLRAMNTPENVLPLSAAYMKIYSGGIIFSMIYNFSGSILRAAGDTKSPLVFLSIAGVVNVVLNVIFVVAFHMDVAGVALATVLSQALAAVLMVRTMAHRTDDCRLQLTKLRMYKLEFARVIRLGLPGGVKNAALSTAGVIIQSNINAFGDIFLTGNSAAGNIEAFICAVIDGIAIASVNYVGQNVGAGRYDRVKKIFFICLGLMVAVNIVLAALVYGFGPQLLSIYITDSQEAISYGMMRMTYMVIPIFLCGILNVSASTLSGMGASFTVMITSFLGNAGIRLLWIYTIFQIPAYHTPENLYLSNPVSWLITFTVQSIAILCIYKSRTARQAASLLPQSQ